MTPLRLFRFGEFGQWLGMLTGLGGTYVQIKENHPWIVWVIMGASVAFAAFTKFKYYARRKRDAHE